MIDNNTGGKKPKKKIIFKLLCLIVIVNCCLGIIPVADSLLIITIPITVWHFFCVFVEKINDKTQDQDVIWKDVALICAKNYKTPVQLISILKKKYTIKTK